MFEYDNEEQKVACESAAAQIRGLGRQAVSSIIQIGDLLSIVRQRLAHGQWLPWLNSRLGLSPDTARRYMHVAELSKKIPQISEFWCIDGVMQFADLPSASQAAILDQEAYTRPDTFKQVAWDSAARAHLDDRGIDKARRYGDVLAAIEDAAQDETIRPVAEKLYMEKQEDFRKLQGESPDISAAMAGIRREARRQEPTGTVNAVYLENQNGGMCPCCGREGVNAAYDVLQVWPGPVAVGIFPTISEPIARAWQVAAAEAAIRRLGARTSETIAERTKI